MVDNASYSLTDIARQAMLDRDMIPDFSPLALKELESISTPQNASSHHRDLRNKFWISIDNDDSLDLDQLTYAETIEGKDIIYVAIADVDGLVLKGSAIDEHAAHNTTSVYTPTMIFPMLPVKLSTDYTSLNPHKERCAIVVEMEVLKDGQRKSRGVYPALVLNHAKLAYNSVSARIEEKAPLSAEFEGVKELIDQLKLQDALALRIDDERQKEGTLNFESSELKAVMKGTIPVDLRPVSRGRADLLIENFMIAANIAVTQFLAKHGVPTLRRVVKTPKRWDRIVEVAKVHGYTLPLYPDNKALQGFLLEQQKDNPSQFAELSLTLIKLIGRGEYVANLPGEKAPGHFDLAVVDYAHTTAPNRRFPDLVMQRFLKSHFFHLKRPYSNQELHQIANHCTIKEDDATKVERRVQKSAAAIVLEPKIGKTFSGFITGASEKGTWVRISNPAIEGKVVRGFKGVDVGDPVKVRLLGVDIPNGFIDFEKVG